MKYHFKNAKSICVLVFTLALLMSIPSVAFAANNAIDTEEEISAILNRINVEYGTNIHVLSESELAQYGLNTVESEDVNSYELVDLEETLRYIAKVRIPQFERTTQEANGVMAVFFSEASVLSTTANTVIATKDIDYATAGVEAYITTDAVGNIIWGSIIRGLCYTDIYQATWFMASNPTVTHTDGRKTLYWVGEGDYCAYINGTHYYLYSGTQYASMYVGDYD